MKVQHPSMVVRYSRCNHSSNKFCMFDWNSHQADVLWVVFLLDNLPPKLNIKSNVSATKVILLSEDLQNRYFLLQAPSARLYEFTDINMPPFLPSSGLNELTVKIKGNWRSLTFRFDFPIEVKSKLSLNGGLKW